MQISHWHTKDIFYMIVIFVIINIIVTLIIKDFQLK